MLTKQKSRYQGNRGGTKKPTLEKDSKHYEDPIHYHGGTGAPKACWALQTHDSLQRPGPVPLFTRIFPIRTPHLLLGGKEGAQYTMGEQSFGPVPPELLPSALPSRFPGLFLSLKSKPPTRHSVLSKQCLTPFPRPVLSPTTQSQPLAPSPSIPHLAPAGLTLLLF